MVATVNAACEAVIVCLGLPLLLVAGHDLYWHLFPVGFANGQRYSDGVPVVDTPWKTFQKPPEKREKPLTELNITDTIRL